MFLLWKPHVIKTSEFEEKLAQFIEQMCIEYCCKSIKYELGLCLENEIQLFIQSCKIKFSTDFFLEIRPFTGSAHVPITQFS